MVDVRVEKHFGDPDVLDIEEVRAITQHVRNGQVYLGPNCLVLTTQEAIEARRGRPR